MKFQKRPVFMIGVAAELIGVHPQTLRMYEQKRLLRPRKSIKNTRLYSQEDIELGLYIKKLTQEMGMNLAGVRKVLEMESRISGLELENERLRREMERAREEQARAIEEVHRSYRREIVLMPRAEITRRRLG
jgi:MerR family transcriptional regulator/heat shock protein HspR